MPHALRAPEGAEKVLHVFDLPQIYTKPSAHDLLNGLALLTTQAPSWDRGDVVDQHNNVKRKPKTGRCKVEPEGVATYLTSIIASGLSWIKDDEEKEHVWEEASLRLAERSGRTGMPAMTRSFTIPTGSRHFELAIHEPSLTGDSIGLKTWAASYLLSKRLHTFKLLRSDNERLRMLELGSGTGLVGMAAAAVFGASVLLTDLADIESNLATNVKLNEQVIAADGGVARSAILDWNKPAQILFSASGTPETGSNSSYAETDHAPFPTIVAADSIYAPEHPAMLVGAIDVWLSREPHARLIIELPRRDCYSNELVDLKQRILELGLVVLEEGEETGYDDWGGIGDDEPYEVDCWWSIWGWSEDSAT